MEYRSLDPYQPGQQSVGFSLQNQIAESILVLNLILTLIYPFFSLFIYL